MRIVVAPQLSASGARQLVSVDLILICSISKPGRSQNVVRRDGARSRDEAIVGVSEDRGVVIWRSLSHNVEGLKSIGKVFQSKLL
jgi:hypothetical protein